MYYSILYALHLRYAVGCGGTVVFHSRAAPRRTPLPCALLCAVHSPFGGQKPKPKPVIVLHRGYIKYCTLSAGVFGRKKGNSEKVPWKLLFPPKTNFGTSPHPTGKTLKAEPHVFSTAPWPNNFCKRPALNIHFYSIISRIKNNYYYYIVGNNFGAV
jgi:hypothetical protein